MCAALVLKISLILLALILCCSALRITDTNENNSEDIEFINVNVFPNNAFIKPDVEMTGAFVAQLTDNSDQNPEELGAYFEGDVLMPSRLDTKNALVGKTFRWPKNMVPYEIHGNFTPEELATIDWAFGEFHRKTCIRFRQQLREKDYISIQNGNSGCWSAAGRIGGKQEVNLQSPWCIKNRGTILHELMHALGFMHEHNRYDRDSFIRVHRENIKEDMMGAFEKLSKNKAHGMGMGYDYTSVMHYSAKSFSKNGLPTIEAKDVDESRWMGQRSGFSAGDVAKINVLYKC